MQTKDTTARRTTRKRGKGDGTLVLRGGKYQARWQVNGKVYVRTTGTGNKREAEKRLAEFTADFRSRDEKHIVECLAARVRGMDAEIERLADERAALPMMAAWTAYTRLQSRPDTGPRTMEMYESQWWRLVKWLKANHSEVSTIQQVTRPIAEAFAEYVARNFSAGTFNKYRVFLRCAWNALAETARLKTNPWEAIRRKKQTSHVRRALTADKLRRVLAAATGEMRVLFAVGAYTGLRLGDCATLHARFSGLGAGFAFPPAAAGACSGDWTDRLLFGRRLLRVCMRFWRIVPSGKLPVFDNKGDKSFSCTTGGIGMPICALRAVALRTVPFPGHGVSAWRWNDSLHTRVLPRRRPRDDVWHDGSQSAADIVAHLFYSRRCDVGCGVSLGKMRGPGRSS